MSGSGATRPPEQYPVAEGSDKILVLALLALMAFFLIRYLRAFSSSGMSVSRGPGKTVKDKLSDDEDEDEDEDGAFDSQVEDK